eukprot:TRINITY_DN24990_c0_g1_i1.p1 TRINITY_DN24990_c0_g1~~TRINITY_DN24990_c0_g1_i1.p1  ORF type:complete len:698 (-),score=69.12 TRINITY_DN24990_c0_g1_i1:80-2173(-)
MGDTLAEFCMNFTCSALGVDFDVEVPIKLSAKQILHRVVAAALSDMAAAVRSGMILESSAEQTISEYEPHRRRSSVGIRHVPVYALCQGCKQKFKGDVDTSRVMSTQTNDDDFPEHSAKMADDVMSVGVSTPASTLASSQKEQPCACHGEKAVPPVARSYISTHTQTDTKSEARCSSQERSPSKKPSERDTPSCLFRTTITPLATPSGAGISKYDVLAAFESFGSVASTPHGSRNGAARLDPLNASPQRFGDFMLASPQRSLASPPQIRAAQPERVIIESEHDIDVPTFEFTNEGDATEPNPFMEEQETSLRNFAPKACTSIEERNRRISIALQRTSASRVFARMLEAFRKHVLRMAFNRWRGIQEPEDSFDETTPSTSSHVPSEPGPASKGRVLRPRLATGPSFTNDPLMQGLTPSNEVAQSRASGLMRNDSLGSSSWGEVARRQNYEGHSRPSSSAGTVCNRRHMVCSVSDDQLSATGGLSSTLGSALSSTAGTRSCEPVLDRASQAARTPLQNQRHGMGVDERPPIPISMRAPRLGAFHGSRDATAREASPEVYMGHVRTTLAREFTPDTTVRQSGCAGFRDMRHNVRRVTSPLVRNLSQSFGTGCKQTASGMRQRSLPPGDATKIRIDACHSGDPAAARLPLPPLPKHADGSPAVVLGSSQSATALRTSSLDKRLKAASVADMHPSAYDNGGG